MSGPVESTIRAVLDSLRGDSGVDLVYLSRLGEGVQSLRIVVGGHPRLGLAEGAQSPLEESFCWRVPQGIIPSVIDDAEAELAVASLPGHVRDGIRGYVSAPVRFADGRLYGTVCCITHSPLGGAAAEIERRTSLVAELIAPAVARFEAERSGVDELRARILGCVEGDGVESLLQPIVSMRTYGLAGFEALTRFTLEPRRGPDWWLGVAGELGLGLDLELALLERSLDAVATIAAPVSVNVNVSPALLLSGRLEALLDARPALRLGVELTEHAVISDYGTLRPALEALAARGHRLVVDDAGAGFASFRHILELRPAVIKLDMSLTRDVDADPNRRALAAALTSFAKRVGSELVVEGVETEAERETLLGLGCDLAQGFLFARPMVWSEVPSWSAERARDRTEAGLAEADLERLTDSAGIPLAVSPAAVVLADASGRYVWATPAARRLLGYPLGELRRLTVADVTADVLQDAFADVWARFQTNGADAGLWAVRTASGQVLPVHFRARTEVLPGIHMSELVPLRESDPSAPGPPQG